jgi:hypothetical protein
MPRPIFTLLAELQSTLAELGEALNPLKALTGALTAMGGDHPYPFETKTGTKRAPRKRAASRNRAPAAPAETPAPAATPKLAKKRRAKGTAARLALQGTYMSALRKLSKADQAEVKMVRSEKGFEAAIKAAESKQ